MNLKNADIPTQFISLLASFAIGYFVVFFLIQIVYFRTFDFPAMYQLLYSSTSEASTINLISFFAGIFSFAALLFWLKPYQLPPEEVDKPIPKKKSTKRKKKKR